MQKLLNFTPGNWAWNISATSHSRRHNILFIYKCRNKKKGIKSVRLQLDALDKVQIYWSKSIILFLNFSCLKASSSKRIRDKYFLCKYWNIGIYNTVSLRGESHPQHTYILYGRNHVAEHILGLETVNIEWMYHISRYSRLKMVCVCGRWPQQIMPYHQHCENISEIVIGGLYVVAKHVEIDRFYVKSKLEYSESQILPFLLF